MKALLVKCHKNTLFSKIEPIVTEPLELEYISSLLIQIKVEHRIYDRLLEGGNFQEVFDNYNPDVLILTGYITAVNVIKEYSQYAKSKKSNIRVIVGGVHAEVNYEDFFADSIDYIVHSSTLETLRNLFDINFCVEKACDLQGIAFHYNGKWNVNNKVAVNIESLPLPNRSYFNRYNYKTKYLNYSPIAIIKTAVSCPFRCNFCYCKELNMGVYKVRSIDSVVDEISKIKSEYIWIVDDTFFIDRRRILKFIYEIKKRKINKKFIAYSRVDFIVNNSDIIKKLKKSGFIEIIVGMEAVEDSVLEDLNKESSSNDNENAVKILRNNNIKLTSLFIAGIDFKTEDFKKMRRWIRKMKIESYTVSIFTPIKGTDNYNRYKDKIITEDYAKWDFLHLIIKPIYISKLSFYFNFYYIYVEQFFLSKYIRKYILKNIKNILKLR